MRAIIHYNGRYEDEFVVTADTIEELKKKAVLETQKRGWEVKYCWSEVEE